MSWHTRIQSAMLPISLKSKVTYALIEWLQAPEQDSLQRAFTVWIKRVLLLGRRPGIHLPEVGNPLEIKTMLAESVIEWTQDWKQQGLQQGRREGLQKGLQQGKVTLLERQLSKRFGPLNESTRSRLSNATLVQLEDIETVEQRQGLKVASCPEEIAFHKGYIKAEQLERLAQPLLKNEYGQYLLGLIRER